MGIEHGNLPVCRSKMKVSAALSLLNAGIAFSLKVDTSHYNNPKNPENGFNKMDLTASQIPEQIRLAYTDDETEMGVFWATSNTTTDDYMPTLWYGSDPGKNSFF